jgi:hypothetical protein
MENLKAAKQDAMATHGWGEVCFLNFSFNLKAFSLHPE